jgi:hypothetical protein
MIDLLLLCLAGGCGSEDVRGYWFDYWDYSQCISTTANLERWNQQHGLTHQPELRISQFFRLLESWTSCSIKKFEMRLELVCMRTNILFLKNQG